MSQFFTSGGQSIGVSALASILPMNIQDWFPLGLTDLISLQSKGLLRDRNKLFSVKSPLSFHFFLNQISLFSSTGRPAVSYISSFSSNSYPFIFSFSFQTGCLLSVLYRYIPSCCCLWAHRWLFLHFLSKFFRALLKPHDFYEAFLISLTSFVPKCPVVT